MDKKLAAVLPEELIQSLKTETVKKHDKRMMTLHWFNAIVWLLLLSTGAALISEPSFRFVPHQFQEFVLSFFGTRATMLSFHIWVGIVWAVVFALYTMFSTKYWPVVKSVLDIDKDDFAWLWAKGLSIMGGKKPMPHQGFFNGGQKMFAVVVYFYTPVIIITGVIMSFQLFSPAVIRMSIFMHYMSVAVILIGLPVHIFMAAFYKPEREGLVAMGPARGYVTEWFALKHNFKWWAQQDTPNGRKVKEYLKQHPEM